MKTQYICVVLIGIFVGLSLAQDTTKYLIVTHSDFEDAIQPLAEWKLKKGIPTKVKTLSGQPTVNNVWDAIHSEWDSSGHQLEYVLLVGNTDKIPLSQNNPFSDNHYADMDTLITDSSYRAELAVGRFPCISAAQCSLMNNKTFAYEKSPTTQDSSWFKETSIIVYFHHVSETVDSYFRRYVDYVAETLMASAWFNVDTLCLIQADMRLSWNENGPDSAESVIEGLNEGRNFLVYRGHANGDWYSPFDNIPTHDSLRNDAMLPIVIGGCCNSLLNPPDTTVGEQWLRVGTLDSLKGSVAYLGNTRADSARYRRHFNCCLFKSIFG